jgi:hypothetical protein
MLAINQLTTRLVQAAASTNPAQRGRDNTHPFQVPPPIRQSCKGAVEGECRSHADERPDE